MVNKFMYFYMYELEEYLKKYSSKIKLLSFQSDEANTDRPLKEFLKKVIEQEFSSIPQNTNINHLNINGLDIVDVENVRNIKIEKVLLPDEVDLELKKSLNNDNSSISTNADLCLKINYNDSIYYKTIELKSTKNNGIPGSSVQQVKPDEWVIFIKHKKGEEAKIVTGQYIHAFSKTMRFPDRSPRPEVSFSALVDWNIKNRIITNNKIIYNINEDDDVIQIVNNWQEILADRLVNIIFNNKNLKSNEPWFNNALREFTISLLEKYDNLSNEEQNNLKFDLSTLIEEYKDKEVNNVSNKFI